VASLKISVDEPGLQIGAFRHETVQQVTASVTVGADVKPGDYLLHLSAGDKPVQAQFGNIIKVIKP
jgi:hypothetical protein